MASRSFEKGNAASEAIQKAGIEGKISPIQLDITDELSIADAVKRVEQDHGRLDALINNAGVYSKATSLREQLEVTCSTNIIGTALVTEAFTPLLLQSPRPYLLHISSSVGSLGRASDPQHSGYEIDARVYRMSKAAVNMLSLQDSKKLGKQGVKVFAVCPGLVESNLRGTSEQAITASGRAGDPQVSGQMILGIIEGKMDADVGKFVDKGGVVPW